MFLLRLLFFYVLLRLLFPLILSSSCFSSLVLFSNVVLSCRKMSLLHHLRHLHHHPFFGPDSHVSSFCFVICCSFCSYSFLHFLLVGVVFVIMSLSLLFFPPSYAIFSSLPPYAIFLLLFPLLFLLLFLLSFSSSSPSVPPLLLFLLSFSSSSPSLPPRLLFLLSFSSFKSSLPSNLLFLQLFSSFKSSLPSKLLFLPIFFASHA